MYGAFESIDTLWHSSLKYLLENGVDTGSRDGKSREVLGASVRLTDPTKNFLCHPGRCLSPLYGAGEFLWYMSGRGDGETIAHYAPSYWRFCESDGYAYGAYGPRIFNGQVNGILETLKAQPDSRQAIISIWKPMDLMFTPHLGKKDIPCTTTLQFIQREGFLHMIVTMRSNDIWLGLPYDIFCWTTLQQFLAIELGLQVGFYHHQVGSLHLYHRNLEAAVVAMELDPVPRSFRFEEKVDFWNGRDRAVKLEAEFRKLHDLNDGHFSLLAEQFGRGSRWGMLVALSLMQSAPKDELGVGVWERFNEFIPEDPLALAIAHLNKQRKKRKV